MHIKKPEDEKYFKDIVLNDILDEISTEVGEKKMHSKPSAVKTKKRNSFNGLFVLKVILYFTLIAVLLFFTLIVFGKTTDAIIEPIPTKALTKKEDNKTQDWKMQKDIIIKKDKISHKKQGIEKNIIQIDSKNIKAIKSKPIVEQKTQRELAKEALRQQMLR